MLSIGDIQLVDISMFGGRGHLASVSHLAKEQKTILQRVGKCSGSKPQSFIVSRSWSGTNIPRFHLCENSRVLLCFGYLFVVFFCVSIFSL